jgi:hypothetical protein
VLLLSYNRQNRNPQNSYLLIVFCIEVYSVIHVHAYSAVSGISLNRQCTVVTVTCMRTATASNSSAGSVYKDLAAALLIVVWLLHRQGPCCSVAYSGLVIASLHCSMLYTQRRYANVCSCTSLYTSIKAPLSASAANTLVHALYAHFRTQYQLY